VRRHRLLPALVLSLLIAVSPGRAVAGEGESALSASLGYGIWWLPGPKDTSIGPDGGAVLGLTYERGISEALSWRVGIAGGAFLGGGISGAGWASGGLVYRFDVLKYVPYVLLAAGGVVIGGDPAPSVQLDPVVELGGGLDLLLGRSRSWGIEARVGTLAGDTTIVTVGVRGTSRWGFF